MVGLQLPIGLCEAQRLSLLVARWAQPEEHAKLRMNGPPCGEAQGVGITAKTMAAFPAAGDPDRATISCFGAGCSST